MSSTVTTTAAVVLGVAALAACKPVQAHQPGARGDVVVATGMSRSGSSETHYAECGDPRAGVGKYRVLIPPALDYELREGQPCPAGPREPMPHDQHPELHAELSESMTAPLPRL